MVNRPGTGLWEVAAATALGAGHTRTGAPNQDAHLITHLPDGVVVAVADGHGGRGYVRSDVGSTTAVEVAGAVMSELAADGGGADRLDAVPEAIVSRWRALVMADLDARPLTAVEQQSATPATLADPYQLYGCTLLVAWFGAHGLWAAQIGDGDIVALVDGRCTSPIPDDDRLVGNLTTSLCARGAASDFRIGAVADVAAGDLVLLATDGYGNSFADAEWSADVLPDLAAGIARHGMAQVRRELPSWVAQSAAMGGDDTTVVIVRRRSHPGAALVDDETAVRTVARPSEPPSAPVPLEDRPMASPGGRGWGRRAAYGLVAGVVAATGVGYAATRLLGGGDATSTRSSATATLTPGGSMTGTAGGVTPMVSSQSCRYVWAELDPLWAPLTLRWPGSSIDSSSDGTMGHYPSGCVISPAEDASTAPK